MDRVKGSDGCGASNCKTCLNVQKTNTFKSSVTGETFHINHGLGCGDKCLIYLITCKVCGIQYVGQTRYDFRYRWSNYKKDSRKAARGEEHMQASFHSHFLSEGHSGVETDGEITLIDKTDASSPLVREQFWIWKLKTLHLEGLNVVESV